MFFNSKRKHLMALAMSIVMLFTLVPFEIFAVDNHGTIAGEEQTVEISANETGERENLFNKDWKFHLGENSSAQNPNFNDSDWEKVSLPHDFSISQKFTTSGEAESGFLPGGTGWYRKSFTMPAENAGKTVILSFDGVYSDAYLYVNGEYVGEHHYGYTAFAFDITRYLHMDGVKENVIAVKAVNNVPTSRWYSGSGIYRDVTLFVMDPVHVDVNGTYVTTPEIKNNNGKVQVQVDVVNNGDASAEVTVTNTVYKKGAKNAVASASEVVTVNAKDKKSVTASPVVQSPELWSLKNPALYVVKTDLTVNGKVVDTYETTFGFRYFSFDKNGFHLNGENVKLNGVCMHHDQGALGSAAYYDAMYRQLSIMKDMGCNAIRTSHNPADEQFIEICNELGLLVMEEAFDGWNEAKNKNRNDFSVYFDRPIESTNNLYGAVTNMKWCEFAIKSMVKRDRNNPCIIAWSLGNEIQEGTDWRNVGQFPGIAENLIRWVKEVDTTRPTTSGDNDRGVDPRLVNVINNIVKNGGIAGFNYCNNTRDLANLAKRFGGTNGCIIASETSSATNSRGIYTSQKSNWGVDGNRHLTSYDTSAVRWGIKAHESIYNTYQLDQIAGEFVWTGFDYIGEPTPYNGPTPGTVIGGYGSTPNSSYFGIVETTGFEKDTYYLYRSQWNKDETTLHLVTAWDSDNMMKSGDKTPVWVYSNAPVVKLYRDGELIGTATRQEHTSPAGHTYYTYTTTSEQQSICSTSSGSNSEGLYSVFNVAYQAGTLSAKAFDKSGNEITLTGNSGKNTVTTPDAVSKLHISQNKTEIQADGSSLVYIAVDVVDANGNLDTTANNNIRFTLEGNGQIVGVDNGDQATNDKYQQQSVLTSTTSANINAYAGKALVIVRSTEKAGNITVRVESEGLTGGSVSVTTTKVGGGENTGLTSYTMVKDYSIKVGTVPTLNTNAVGHMADGTTVSGTIAWNSIGSDVYNKAGDYTVNGTLTFEGHDPIAVNCKLHVIANIIALRNVSNATTVGVAPTLPTTVAGVLADGTLSGEFNVNWDEVDASIFQNVGEIVVVKGTATIFGDETLPVTMSVRVAEAVKGESTNVAPMASELSQSIDPSHQSDKLESIRNGNKKPGDDVNERWTNWGNRQISAEATLTFRWDTAQTIGSVELYYYYDRCCAYPEKVEFKHSPNGTEYEVIGHTAEEVETYDLGAHYRYTFTEPVNPVSLQIVFTQKGGTSGSNCVGVCEAEIMSFVGKLEKNTSAALSGIQVDGTALDNFSGDTLEYTATGSQISAATDCNAGITVLPSVNNVVRILTISEDGSDSRTYTVTGVNTCKHTHTEIRNQKDPTCTEDGYSGDVYCVDCQTVITPGKVVPATGHNYENGVCTHCGAKDPDFVGVDKTQLQKLYDYAISLDLNGYTAESVEAFNTALQNAKDVLADESLGEADQAVVDAAAEKLSAAIRGLTVETAPTPGPDVKPEPPKTGDNGSVMLAFAALIASAAAAAFVIWDSKKNRNI